MTEKLIIHGVNHYGEPIIEESPKTALSDGIELVLKTKNKSDTKEISPQP